MIHSQLHIMNEYVCLIFMQVIEMQEKKNWHYQKLQLNVIVSMTDYKDYLPFTILVSNLANLAQSIKMAPVGLLVTILIMVIYW